MCALCEVLISNVLGLRRDDYAFFIRENHGVTVTVLWKRVSSLLVANEFNTTARCKWIQLHYKMQMDPYPLQVANGPNPTTRRNWILLRYKMQTVQTSLQDANGSKSITKCKTIKKCKRGALEHENSKTKHIRTYIRSALEHTSKYITTHRPNP